MRLDPDRFDYLEDLDLLIARLLIEGYNRREIADTLIIGEDKLRRIIKRIGQQTRRQIARRDFGQQYLKKWGDMG